MVWWKSLRRVDDSSRVLPTVVLRSRKFVSEETMVHWGAVASNKGKVVHRKWGSSVDTAVRTQGGRVKNLFLIPSKFKRISYSLKRSNVPWAPEPQIRWVQGNLYP